MVGEDIDYVVVTVEGVRYILAESRLASYARELGVSTGSTTEFDVTWRGKGADLVGLTYTPPFTYYAGHENAFRVVPAEFVTTTDGTGMVHTAGAFGEDDKIVTDREGIEAVMPVGKDGKFTFPVVDYEGLLVFDANLQIIDHLKAATRWHGGDRLGLAGHGAAAPRDLRPQLPALLALPRAADLQGRLVVVRRGDRDQGADARAQPGDQLGARPHPGRPVRPLAGERPRLVDHPQPLLGLPGAGVEERRPDVPPHRRLRLVRGDRADFGRLPRNKDGEPDLHRPYVDDLVRPNPDDPTGQSMMRRVVDVLDVWFDSGSM